jgi:ribosome-binding protein aMBF1 (putative translation factor)
MAKKLEVHSLWYWRKKALLSETELANAVGVHMNCLRNWQTKPSVIPLQKAKMLAEILGIKVEQIESEHDYHELNEVLNEKIGK